jgi:hypothetical protein
MSALLTQGHASGHNAIITSCLITKYSALTIVHNVNTHSCESRLFALRPASSNHFDVWGCGLRECWLYFMYDIFDQTTGFVSAD